MFFKNIIVTICLIFLVVATIIGNNKRKKQKKKLTKDGCMNEFNCELVIGGDKVMSRMIILRNHTVSSNVLLFDDHVAFATGATKEWQPEIMISDINFVKMEKLLWKDLLFIDHNAKFEEKGKTKSKYVNQFYLSGDKEELLYIKDFIEERMNGLKRKKNNPLGDPS